MARYIVDFQIDNHEKYYFIREQESQDIVLLPSKYLMHKKRSKLSPNTIRRSAGAISYYLNYIDETGIHFKLFFHSETSTNTISCAIYFIFVH
mgnify:CR=1 FL=1